MTLASIIQNDFTTMQWGGCLTQCNSQNLTDALERIKGKAAELAAVVHLVIMTNNELGVQMNERIMAINLLETKANDIVASSDKRFYTLEWYRDEHHKSIQDLGVQMDERKVAIWNLEKRAQKIEQTANDIATSSDKRFYTLEWYRDEHHKSIQDFGMKMIEAEKLLATVTMQVSEFEEARRLQAATNDSLTSQISSVQQRVSQLEHALTREETEKAELRRQVELLTEENKGLNTKLNRTMSKVDELENKFASLHSLLKSPNEL